MDYTRSLVGCKATTRYIVVNVLIGTGIDIGISAIVRKAVGGNMNWFDSAIELLGDILDPFLPGGAGSELRPTSRKVSLATINAQRSAAGLPPISGRRRRKRALTKSDREDIGFIAGMISKAAARDFAMIIAGSR